MFKSAIPCSCGPFANSNDTPSHYNKYKIQNKAKKKLNDKSFKTTFYIRQVNIQQHDKNLLQFLNIHANFYMMQQMFLMWRTQSTITCFSFDC